MRYVMCAYYVITFANGHNKHIHMYSYVRSCLRVVYKVMAESITRPNPCKSHLVNTYSNGVSDFSFLNWKEHRVSVGDQTSRTYHLCMEYEL
jgi:hypothetical protein